jgi:hypothetical protein
VLQFRQLATAYTFIGRLISCSTKEKDHRSTGRELGMGLREIESTLPPGFRFYPSDEELVCHYLYKKVANERAAQGTLVEVDLHAREPWELPGEPPRPGHLFLCLSLSFSQNPLDVHLFNSITHRVSLVIVVPRI